MRAIVAIVVGVVVANIARGYLPDTSSVALWTFTGIITGSILVGFIAPGRAWLLGCITGVIDAAISAFLTWFVWMPVGNYVFPLAWGQPFVWLLAVEPIIGLIVAEVVYRYLPRPSALRRNIPVPPDGK